MLKAIRAAHPQQVPDEIRALYAQAFPKEEQIPWDDLLRLMEEMPLLVTAYYDGETFVGFTVVYPRQHANWFWYFAVVPTLRGKGYGQQILTGLLAEYEGQTLVLDIESPEQPSDNREQRRRRHAFYLRNGFRDTHVGKTYDNIAYTILTNSDEPFTMTHYEALLSDLWRFWQPER